MGRNRSTRTPRADSTPVIGATALRGLYLAGGSANPGPGVPMVLMSGVTAAHAALRDRGLSTAGRGATGRKAEAWATVGAN